MPTPYLQPDDVVPPPPAVAAFVPTSNKTTKYWTPATEAFETLVTAKELIAVMPHAPPLPLYLLLLPFCACCRFAPASSSGFSAAAGDEDYKTFPPIFSISSVTTSSACDD